MFRVLYYHRTITEAVYGKPWHVELKQFKHWWTAKLFTWYTNSIFSPGKDYEKAHFVGKVRDDA